MFNMKKIFTRLLVCGGLFISSNATAAVDETEQFNTFVNKMAVEHLFDSVDLKQLFQNVDIKNKIIETMNRPAEGLPWYKYRKIFMTEKRIKGGVEFWQEYDDVLTAVEKQYGVPAEIIIAIIGVETQYGGNTGNHRVIDALSTLGFSYPKRSKFFLSELENFLILCREEKMDPLQPTGSYAGAMGIPQFMPSSYRAYAADFEGDEKRDIWNNPADAIASVANYFVKHHWKKGEPVIYPVVAEGEAYKTLLTKGLKPDLSWSAVSKQSIYSDSSLKMDDEVKLLAFEQPESRDLWVGLNNFYVITRYNHSPLYAMAVFQLSEAIYQLKSKGAAIAMEQSDQVDVKTSSPEK